MKTLKASYCAGILLAGVTLLGCKKEYYTEEAPLSPGNNGSAGGGDTAYVLSFQDSEWRVVNIDADSSSWDASDAMGHVTLGPLFPGDRLVADFQVGLQMSGACTNGLSVTAGCILGSSLSDRPNTPDIILLNGESSLATDPWPAGAWIQQFMRHDEYVLEDTILAPIVQAFAKPWSTSCGPEDSASFVTNSSLTLVIIHEY